MGNDQAVQDVEISPKITKAIDTFKQKLAGIESAKERRALILECKVPHAFDKEFDLNQWIHIARYVLQHDATIANMRQKCVPSLIKETEFWKRYFFLVKEEKKRQRQSNSDKPSKSADDDHDKKEQEKAKEQKNHKKEKKKDKDKENSKEHATAKQEEEKEDDEEAYQVLLHKPVIWLYKIGATIWRGRNNKCELWGLRNPIWMGRLRIVAFRHGTHLQFQFLEKDGKLFLKSTLIKLDEITDDDSNPIHQYFDAYGVIDSSRYFIIWVDVPSKTRLKDRVPFGFGIRERQDAFDIRACVADQMKIIRRRYNLGPQSQDEDEDEDEQDEENLNDTQTATDEHDQDDQGSEYEWVTDTEYDGSAEGQQIKENLKDEVERKCVEVEVEMDGDNDGKKEMQKKWMKRVKVEKKRKKKRKRKNRFELGEDEMISIGHNIDNIDHHFDAHAKHKHSTILKVKMNDAEGAGKDTEKVADDLYLLPPPPSPPLTPTNELDDHIKHGNKNSYKVEYDDEDFGEFQLPNDDNDNDNENENEAELPSEQNDDVHVNKTETV